MANKEFKIQSDTVSLNGVPLSSSTDGKVVIPGVTRATGYRVEEIEDIDDQTYQFAPNSEVVVIDAALYRAIVEEYNENHFADFTAETDDDGEIDDITVNGRGTYNGPEADLASSSDMYAYVGSSSASDRPLVPEDWIQIPFRPKMKSTGIESEFGSGGSVDGLDGNTDYEPEEEGDVSYELNINDTVQLKLYQSAQGDDNLGPGLSLGNSIGDPHRSGVVAIGNDDVGFNSKQGGVYIGAEAGWNETEAPQGEFAVAIGAFAARNFAEDNSITLNATGDHLDPTSNGLFIKPIRQAESSVEALYYDPNSGEVTYGQPLDLSLSDDKEIKITVGNTEYFAIVNRANNKDEGVEASAVAYDADGNMITLHISNIQLDEEETSNPNRAIVSKFDDTGTVIWQKQIDNFTADSDTSHDLCIIDGNAIVVTLTVDSYGPLGIDSVLVVRLDSTGDQEWNKIIYGNNPVEVIEGVNIGNSNITGSGQYNGTDYMIIFVDGDYAQGPTPLTLQESTDETNWTTLATSVFSQWNSGTNETALFVPLETTVSLEWPTKFYRLVSERVNSWHELGAVATDGDDIYIAVEYEEDNDNGNSQGIVVKIAGSNGNMIWTQQLGSPGYDSTIFGMDVGPEGDVFVVGRISSQEAPSIVWANKLNSAGEFQWGTAIFNNEQLPSSGGDIVVDSQNNAFVTVNQVKTVVMENGNNSRSTAHVVKLDSNGAIVWARRAGPGPCASVSSGIDCDATGNVYLSVLTAAQNNPVRDDEAFFENDIQTVLALCKFSTDGEVLWQRYIEADAYDFYASRTEDNNPTVDFDAGYNRGRNLSLGLNGKLAVQVTVRNRDFDLNDNGNDNYFESIIFQIDQDGREMTVGSGVDKFTVRESRIPGKFVTLPAYEVEFGPEMSEITEDMFCDDATVEIEDGELAQVIMRSAPYEYAFGNDGTLTIPNDGDIKLTQTQLGWFSIFGRANNNDDDIWFRANCVDPSDGSVYAVGEDDMSGSGVVVRYNSQGQILWSIKLNDVGDGNNTRCNAVTIHPVEGTVVVLCEYYGPQTGALLLQLDPDTARVESSVGFKDLGGNNDVNAYDFDFLSTGAVVVVGRKYDEYVSQTAAAQSGSGFDTLVVANSAIENGPVTDSWYVSGPGITGRATINYVNRYTGLTGTTREGSGAIFDVTTNDGGPGIYTVVVSNGGTNYLPGHKILIAGTSLGGTTPGNDLVIEVATASSGVITTVNVSGTAGVLAFPTYTEVSGTNYNVGSGLVVDIGYAAGSHNYYNITTAGSNYVAGDVVTILGTALGGATPANNLTITVVNVDVSGGITQFAMAGTPQDTKTTIVTNTSGLDYGSVTGPWQVQYAVGGEAFVYTADAAFENPVTKVLSAGGTNDTERYFSVALDADGNIYAAGEMISRNDAAGSDLNTYWCAVVSKFNSSGVHQWTKALNNTLNDCYAKCVAVNGNTVVVTHQNSGTYSTVVTKLDSTGSIKWQRSTYSNDDSSVAIDTNGDIYAVIEGYFENRYENMIKLIKFAPNGEVAYRKFFGTLVYDYGGTNEYFKNGRNLTIDGDHLYVSGYTTAFTDNYDNGFLVKLPKDASCEGSYSGWVLQNEIYNVDKLDVTEATEFTPTIGTGEFETWSPDFNTNWFDPSYENEYQTFTEIVDRDGGAIVFADGTRQTSSAQLIPQRKIFNGADHRLQPEDSGRHIFITNYDTDIIVPYNEDSPLPIGFTVTVINNTEGTVNIDADGGGITVRNGSTTYSYWDLASYGMATLIKVDTNYWYITGNVSVD